MVGVIIGMGADVQDVVKEGMVEVSAVKMSVVEVVIVKVVVAKEDGVRGSTLLMRHYSLGLS